MSAPDHVGRIINQWRTERPDLDHSPLGVIGRLHRLAQRLNDELRTVFAEAGLRDWEYDVLAALRRSGAPYELTPGQLAETTMITSGGMTKRVDRLQEAGLVTRTVSPQDGRSRRIALTPKGFDLVDSLVERHLANEHRLLAGFTDGERAELARLLEDWGQHLDG